MADSRSSVGLIVTAAPETVTLALPTGMVSKMLLLLERLIMILPVPFCTFSFKVITKLVATAIPVLLWAGERLTKVGATLSPVVNFQMVLPVKPAKLILLASLNAPLAISTYTCVLEGKFKVGLIVATSPDTVMAAFVTAIVSRIALSLTRLITILPAVPFTTARLNVMSKLAVGFTRVALFKGLKAVATKGARI